MSSSQHTQSASHKQTPAFSLGTGRFRNTPPVLDASGRVFVALDRSVYALDPDDGHTLWRLDTTSKIASSPIVAPGRLYLGTAGGSVLAVGDCP